MNYPLDSLGRYLSPVLDVSLENGAIFLSQSNRQVNMMINSGNRTKNGGQHGTDTLNSKRHLFDHGLWLLMKLNYENMGLPYQPPLFAAFINDVRRRKCIRKMA
ncbi:hypothetical protein BCR42DRAFT_457304 [Absidia repens]|uniref:Uncharacterized protein n=1 Tax=Absidia repens TaxID=90262 RepID=A0A1X2HX17_9FUNG|nr:hypothetical protein BCR42DRAFT_457304 [Absidia repens]